MEEDEISLLDYWHVIIKRKRVIFSMICVTIIASVIILLLMPNIYRAEVFLAPVEDKESNGSVGLLLGQFSGLASMAGISLGWGSYEINLAVLKSRSFIKKIEILDKHLKDLAIKEAEANITYLTKQREESPLLEMRQVLYSVVAEQTRQIMLAKAQQYFAFKIIDPPEPLTKSTNRNVP